MKKLAKRIFFELSWKAATDGESSSKKYFVYNNDRQISETSTTSFSETTVQPGTMYSYEVSAVNSAGF